jgi:hypothetical protein
MSAMIVREDVIKNTLFSLQQAGRKRNERVLLWLAGSGCQPLVVKEVYTPQQRASRDVFRIPRNGISSLLDHLRKNHLMVAAQVHTHPRAAFHSVADDTWAIVRHVGALSLVLPEFAMSTSVSTFRGDAMVFRLSSANAWEQVPVSRIDGWYEVVS